MLLTVHPPKYFLPYASRAVVAAFAVLATAVLLVAASSGEAHAAAAKQTDIWVAPNGDDRADGARRRPVRTLVRARNLARAAARGRHGTIRVILRGGTYRLSSPLVLDARDSGRSSKAQIVWRAASGELPVITGARRVTGWTLFDSTRGIYRAKVPAGSSSRQLFVNGRRATRARGSTNPVGFTRTAEGYTTSDPTMASWGNLSDVELVTMTQWKTMRCPVASITGQQIAMQQPCWNNVNVFPYLWSFQLVTRVENAYELLDSAGEWYLDEPGGWLYYMPRVGEEIGRARAELPVAEALIDGRGTLAKPVHDIRFEGLTFRHATWLGPSGPDGYAADQSGFHLTGEGHPATPSGHDPNVTRTPGNVRFVFARGIEFVRNDFTGLGAVGLDFDTGSQRNRIVGNRFVEIGSAAVQLGGVDVEDHHPTSSGQVTRDNLISNNLIKKTGRDYQDAAGVMVGFTTRTTVANNDISDVPWSGIAIGWGWGLVDPGGFVGAPNADPARWGSYTTPTTSRGNRIMNNRIRRFLMTLWDGGAIYSLGQQGTSIEDGELIFGNVMSNKRRLAGGNTMYTDGGSRYVTLQQNVSFNNHPGITDFGPCGLPDSLLVCWAYFPYGADRGGCRPYGDLVFSENWWQYPGPFWEACPYPPHPVSVTDDNNTVITGAGELSRDILDRAGRQGRYRSRVGAG